jgi:hypothetical protein
VRAARRRAAEAPATLIVLGGLASSPYAGLAWMQLQMAAGFLRLGHDAYYMEATSVWPYDPVRRMKVDDSDYAVPYLARAAECFGLSDRWAYRRGYSDRAWLGPVAGRADELLAHADAVFNVAGGTRARTKEGLTVGRLVYYGTDPPYQELATADHDPIVRRTIDQHDDFVTFGENIGTPHSPVPPLPGLRAWTRQPVLLDRWGSGPPSNPAFTTIGNWKQEGHDLEFEGETYLWSKHHEFLKFIDLPRRVRRPVELAMGLEDADTVQPGFGEMIPAAGMTLDERLLLHENGWRLTNAHAFSHDVAAYREYICASSGEFTVAKDQNVRLRTGWFSERSACYLAAGRPVITQDTGFGHVLPTGEGLFAFNTMDEILAAFEAVESDYERQSRAAREIASEYFRAETVLAKLIEDLGL